MIRIEAELGESLAKEGGGAAVDVLMEVLGGRRREKTAATPTRPLAPRQTLTPLLLQSLAKEKRRKAARSQRSEGQRSLERENFKQNFNIKSSRKREEAGKDLKG